jgi:hypothetical protein
VNWLHFFSPCLTSLKHLTKALDRLVYLHDAFLASQKEIEKVSFTDVWLIFSNKRRTMFETQ